MYYDKELARNSLQQIENAILKIEERASSFHSADDFLKHHSAWPCSMPFVCNSLL